MTFHRILAALFVSGALAGCGGATSSFSPLGVSSPTPAPTATVAPTATPASGPSIAAANHSAQALPAANGESTSVTLAASASTPANATISVTASTGAPAGFAAFARRQRHASTSQTVLAYYTFVPSTDIDLVSFPAFTIAFPASALVGITTVHEAFLDGSTQQPVYTLDVAFGANSSTLTSTAIAPILHAGKTYLFVFYTDSGITPTPTPVPSSSPSATPTTAAADITIPATINTAAQGQQSITDAAFFNGFAGTHVFGRGASAPYNGGDQTGLSDCKLVVGNGKLVLTGGGDTISAPFISTNPNAKTNLFAYPDSLHIGGIELITFYDQSGAGINLGVTGGVITAVGGIKTGDTISCGTIYASSITADRSNESLTFAQSTLAPFITNAGTNYNYTQTNIKPSDLGGAAGTAVIGLGTVLSGSTVTKVYDCTIAINGGTLTATAGSFHSSATFTGSASDAVQVVTGQGSPRQFEFRPENGKVLIIVNGYGFVTHVSAWSGTDKLNCPL